MLTNVQRAKLRLDDAVQVFRGIYLTELDQAAIEDAYVKMNHAYRSYRVAYLDQQYENKRANQRTGSSPEKGAGR